MAITVAKVAAGIEATDDFEVKAAVDTILEEEEEAITDLLGRFDRTRTLTIDTPIRLELNAYRSTGRCVVL